MGREIERKFLVASDAWRAGAGEGTPYRQAYLVSDEARSVRVRLAGSKAFLTIKGPTKGASRDEFEYPIPAADAHAMIDRLAGEVVSKRRYLVPVEGHTWEVDVFEGENDGLIVAEIELGAEAERFAMPAWAGAEVTYDPRYLNSNLAKAPFRSWPSGARGREKSAD